MLKQPDAALLATLTDRAGMMLAPKTLADPAGVARASGVFGAVQVRSARAERSRRAREIRRLLGRRQISDPARGVPADSDSTVRLANLRSGSLDMLERLARLRSSRRRRATPTSSSRRSASFGYYYVTFNTRQRQAQQPRCSKDRRVRQAFELAIDRDAISEVIGAGIFAPANQAVPTSSPYYNASLPMSHRDIAEGEGAR